VCTGRIAVPALIIRPVDIDLADLPSDVAALQALVRRFAEAVNAQELKIVQLERALPG